MVEKPVFIIDAASFDTLAGFVEECNRSFIRLFGGEWRGNLDAFADYFWWGDAAYIVTWKNSEKSRVDLGHPAMADWLTQNSKTCHPSNAAGVLERRAKAIHGDGPTLFDWLVEIIRDQEHVELRLE